MSTQPKALPELLQTALDAKTLDALFDDLEACTEILAALPKTGTGYTTPQLINLREGQRLLAEGKLRGLQIRYRYQGEEWWDTLIQRHGQVQITRIQQNFG